jgi:uncharacterized membrane protein YraQ (UPF0718 family)
METFFANAGELAGKTLQAVYASVTHNWKILAIAAVIAVALKTYVNSEKLTGLLMKKRKVSILASVLFGAFTPFCACGTSAVVLGMLSTTLPWGPIMAFLTSSPLMSPDGFVLISGVISVSFAIALTVASLAIGLASGFVTNIIEKKTVFLKDQSRYLTKETAAGCSCKEKRSAICCSTVRETAPSWKNLKTKLKLKEFVIGIYELGIRRMLISFSIFIAVGYLINSFVPASIISALFGAKAFYAVPLASLIGLPLYLTTESGIPMIQSMMASGASEGAMLAFIITGAATSAWVIAGLSTFMKKRAILLYTAFILVGGILSGYLYDLFLMLT